MSQFIIRGGKQLKGEIKISGSKNAALKLLPASILSGGTCRITNVPDIADIRRMIEILESIEAKITFENGTVIIDSKNIKSFRPDEELVKKLRGSIVLVGPLLAKFGQAILFEPGGCLIGSRPIDDHLDVFRQMGVSIHEKNRVLHLIGRPKAGEIILNKMSVTATENAMMAAILTSGTTKIRVAACEPEIAELADFLNKMGAKISGAGTHDITIEGVAKLSETTHEVIPDRIEAGTYLIAAVATNSKIKIGPIVPEHLSILFKKLWDCGANFCIISEKGKQYIKTKSHRFLSSINIDTRTYPGFSTDLQSPFAVLMTQAKGKSTIFETLFEGRFLFLDELSAMGAKTEILSPHIINIVGPIKLKGITITSRDIRGGAALVIAGLIAEGETVIRDEGYIDRGYEKMDEKLRLAGADITKVD